jgi:hypothetical protein
VVVETDVGLDVVVVVVVVVGIVELTGGIVETALVATAVVAEWMVEGELVAAVVEGKSTGQ